MIILMIIIILIIIIIIIIIMQIKVAKTTGQNTDDLYEKVENDLTGTLVLEFDCI